jgi:hypothetical protein
VRYLLLTLVLALAANHSLASGDFIARQKRLTATGYRYSIQPPADWKAEYWQELGRFSLCTVAGPCTTDRGGYPVAGRGVIYVVPIESITLPKAPSSVEEWLILSNESGVRRRVPISLPTDQKSSRRCIRTSGVDDLHPTVQIRRDVYYLQEDMRFVKVICESNEGDPKYQSYLSAATEVLASLVFARR